MKQNLWVIEEYHNNEWHETDYVCFNRKEARLFCKSNKPNGLICRYKKYVSVEEKSKPVSEPLAFYNINDIVMVYLTRDGIEVLMDYYMCHKPIGDYSVFPSGFNKRSHLYKTELWNLMLIFGRFLYMGNTKQMFINNIFGIKKD